MGKINKGYKVFISYKYRDSSVLQLPGRQDDETMLTTARHYVDIIQEAFEDLSHINKGEKDGEDLSQFKDETIESKLRDKIFDSKVTIVLISPEMRNMSEDEDEQWIPWEIRYSLRKTTRNDRTSRRNAILGVVLPDRWGKHTYAITRTNCLFCSCVHYPLTNSFTILSQLVFNRKNPEMKSDCTKNLNIYLSPHSYMHLVTWDEFIENIDRCLDAAVALSESSYEWNMPNLNT